MRFFCHVNVNSRNYIYNFVRFLMFQCHVVFPHYILSHEERYFPSPEQFVPERWLRDDPNHDADQQTGSSMCEHARRVHRQQKDVGIHPFASLPFGFGRRMCIGKRFAEAELQLLLAKVGKSSFTFFPNSLVFPVQ